MLKSGPMYIAYRVMNQFQKLNHVFPVYMAHGHKGSTVLLPGFAINWLQNQVTKQLHLRDLSHMSMFDGILYSIYHIIYRKYAL